MTLAVHRLAGAAAALAAGGTIIFGSMFLISKSYTTLPALFMKHPAPSNIVYFQTYKTGPTPTVDKDHPHQSPNDGKATSRTP